MAANWRPKCVRLDCTPPLAPRLGSTLTAETLSCQDAQRSGQPLRRSRPDQQVAGAAAGRTANGERRAGQRKAESNRHWSASFFAYCTNVCLEKTFWLIKINRRTGKFTHTDAPNVLGRKSPSSGEQIPSLAKLFPLLTWES